MGVSTSGKIEVVAAAVGVSTSGKPLSSRCCDSRGGFRGFSGAGRSAAESRSDFRQLSR